MNTIIFGQNSVNTIGLVRSLGQAGHQVYAILQKTTVNYTTKSKYIKKVWFVKNSEEWLPTIISVCNSVSGKIALFSTGDEEAKFVNQNRNILNKYCFIEGTKNEEVGNSYFSKDYIYKLADNVGLELIDSYILKGRENIDLPKIEFPALVKALDSTCGGKDVMNVCNDYESLGKHIESLKDQFFPIQIQPFLVKEKEIMLQGCSMMNGEEVLSPVCFVKTRFSGCGNGYGSYGYSVFTDDDPELHQLKEKIAAILKAVGYNGLFSAEFLYANNHYYFLEINFRNDGTAIVSTKSGYNLPDIQCQGLQNTFYRLSKKSFHKIYYMYEDDFKHVIRRELRLCKWIKDVFKKDCHWYMIDNNDWKPFIYYIIFRINRKITKYYK